MAIGRECECILAVQLDGPAREFEGLGAICIGSTDQLCPRNKPYHRAAQATGMANSGSSAIAFSR